MKRSLRVLALVATIVLLGSGLLLAATSSISGGSITAVKVVRNPDTQSTTSTVWTDLPGATTNIVIPGNSRAHVLVRFSAESFCMTNGGDISNYCSLRVIVGGQEAEPAVGTDFVFDAITNADFQGDAHSMERSIGPLSPGTYPVTVQWTTVVIHGGIVTFTLDDWSLTVERVAASAV